MRIALLALGGGMLMALAFPLGPPLPHAIAGGWWPAGWLCLAPLMLAAALAASSPGAALAGFAYGLTAFLLTLAWLHPFLVRWAYLGPAEAAAILLLLAAYVALYTAAFSWLVHVWRRRWGHSVAFLLAPAAWVALEFARDRLLAGFPWGLLGYTQQPALISLQVADLAGVYGVSFLLATAAAFAAAATFPLCDRAAPAASRTALIAPLILVALGLGYGAVRLISPGPGGESVPVALIQANIAQEEKWDPGEKARIEADHVAMTREATAGGARLVIWSESSVPISLSRHPDYAERLDALASETGSDLLVGSVAYEPGEGGTYPYNSVYSVLSGRGVADRYDKRKLVPFGEYVPLKRMLPFLEPLVEEASDFHPGDPGGGLLSAGGMRLGMLICYEAIFPELARRETARGAGALVNMTNDAWYGDTGMPRQHLAMAVLRSVENRRFLLRCANTGISAIVDPTGRIVREARLDEPAIVTGRVIPSGRLTVYASIGDSFAGACVILTLLALARAWRGGPHRPPSKRDIPGGP